MPDSDPVEGPIDGTQDAPLEDDAALEGDAALPCSATSHPPAGPAADSADADADADAADRTGTGDEADSAATSETDSAPTSNEAAATGATAATDETDAAATGGVEPSGIPDGPRPSPTPRKPRPSPTPRAGSTPAADPAAAEPAPADPVGIAASAPAATTAASATPDPDPDPNEAATTADSEPRRSGLLDDIVGTGTPRPAASGKSGTGRRHRVLLAVGVLVLAGLIAGLVARTYEIPSESMESTLHGCRDCDNDRVLVDRLVYRFTGPVPGDVVVFTAGPEIWKNSEVSAIGETNPIVRGFDALLSGVGISAGADTSFVKRVIAVGGQTVSCCDARNRIVVDQHGIDEPYVYFAPAAGPARQQAFPPYTVPEGKMFVMGDNRNQSLDSRAAGNGAVPLSSLVGKVRFIVLPVGRFGPVASIDPQHRPTP